MEVLVWGAALASRGSDATGASLSTTLGPVSFSFGSTCSKVFPTSHSRALTFPGLNLCLALPATVLMFVLIGPPGRALPS